ncbi:MAG: phosphomevalonate kinase [Candidatus Aenigmarchaeota archaeon]|nr:phosphomevalonate kinase [Candidatus Aenigmarchaeota archaeon]
MNVSAPGKLFLSGEWAVLEVGSPGIVVAVNKRVHVEIKESDQLSITVDDFNIKDVLAEFDGVDLVWITELNDKKKEKLTFTKVAIETVLQYLENYKPFSIRSWGDESQISIDGVAKKVGFGSSAAAVVAIIAAILKFNGMNITSRETKDLIYKLSAIAHYFAQGKVGSAFDVAASTYGGVFVYKRFDPVWLTKEMEDGRTVKHVAGHEWPGFYVEELKVPKDFILLVGWTKESASTSAMVKQMDLFKNDSPVEYKKIYDSIGKLVSELEMAWKSDDRKKIIELLRKNEDILRELGSMSGVNIETPELRQLAELANKNGAAGKLSGAGGGDCGIAVCFDKEIADKVKKAWQSAGLYLLDVTIDYEGVK